MFWQRVASLVNVFMWTGAQGLLMRSRRTFCRARKGLGTSLALQRYAGLISSGFLHKVASGDND